MNDDTQTSGFPTDLNPAKVEVVGSGLADRVRPLAEACEEFRKTRRGGQQYPKELKAQIVALLEGGQSVNELSRQLGICKSSLRHWHKAPLRKHGSGFEEVRVIGANGSYSLRTPRGYTIAELSKPALIDLIKTLG